MAALHPFDELEGAAADHRFRLALLPVLHRVLLGGRRRVEHEACAVPGEHVEHERVRVLQTDLHGEGIEHLDTVHGFVERPHPRLGGRIHDALDAELDRGSVDRGAVVEEDVLPELEGVEETVG